MLEALQNTNGPILITGNTGFKGAWLTQILDYLDINYVGVALPPEKKSLFEVAGLSTKKSIFLDLRNFDQLLEILEQHRPVAVIHLAAQPLVLEAYKNTIETFSNNVMSTVTLLEAIRNTPSVRAIAVVTTDKVYENKNERKKYVEKADSRELILTARVKSQLNPSLTPIEIYFIKLMAPDLCLFVREM